MTPQKLDLMIIDAVQEHGKISLVDLPNHLMIGPDSISKRLDSVFKKSDIRLIDDTLISSQYLDRLCEEINEELSLKDELNFADLAIKHNFGLKFLTAEIEKRLGSVIDGVLNEDRTGIMTEKYLKLVRAKAKGMLRAQQAPASLAKLSKELGFDAKKFELLISTLKSQGDIDGEVRAGQYIPRRFQTQKV